MKVNGENIKKPNISNILKERQIDIGYLGSLYIDLIVLNNELENLGMNYKKLYIDLQDYHNEYSPERTDPCPDYYGYFTLRFENNPNEKIGDYMTLGDLDNVLCTLVDLIEYK